MKKHNRVISIVFLAFIFSLSVLLFALPKRDYSQNEKRNLQEFPSFSVSALFDGSFFKDIETFVSDQFPFRDLFVGINSYYNLITGRNGINGVYKAQDGYLIAEPEKVDFERLTRNTNRINNFTKEQKIRASLILVPTPGSFLEDKLPKNHKEYHDDEIFTTVIENVNGFEFIDIRKTFSENKDTQIYFKTDHHLTTNGSYLMYKEFCESKYFPAVTDFKEKKVLEDFYGTNYSKSGLWLEKPDTVEVWYSKNNYKYEVTIDDLTEKNTYETLYFYKHNENMDKYPVFLDGNHALVTIKNKDVSNGKRILIVKDSYAHCFATFLAENYEEIYMVDLRYYRKSTSSLIKEKGINELLFLFGAQNFANMSDIAWLS